VVVEIHKQVELLLLAVQQRIQVGANTDQQHMAVQQIVAVAGIPELDILGEVPVAGILVVALAGNLGEGDNLVEGVAEIAAVAGSLPADSLEGHQV